MSNEKCFLTMFLMISEILYEKDPADTSCKENNIIEEYDKEASMIVSKFADSDNKISLDDIKEIFNDCFDGYYSEESIEAAWPAIKRVIYENV